MKAAVVLCTIFLFGLGHCSVITSPSLLRIPSLDSAIVRSERIGGNFAYSTVEQHAYAAAPVIHTPQSVHLQYSVPQPLYSYPIYGPSVISSPIYTGIHTHPSFGAPIVAQNPIFSLPGQFPVQSPVQSPIVAPPQGGSVGDAPVAGATVDDDSVSVEAAL